MTLRRETRATDALFVGAVFLDIILDGLERFPAPGEEVWAARRAVSAGGVANNAVAAARLGLRTVLVAELGGDALGAIARAELEREPGLDLSGVCTVPGRETPLTVAAPIDGDRSFLSQGALTLPPVTQTADAAAAFLTLTAESPTWLDHVRSSGARVFADVAWDQHTGWDAQLLDQLAGVDVFLPNATEAMAYTRTTTPEAAARELASRVPLVVVTCGPDGVIAQEGPSGRQLRIPAVRVPTTDATGAGDVFASALMCATLTP